MLFNFVVLDVTHVKVGGDVGFLVVDVVDDDGQDGGGGRGCRVSKVNSGNL
jgi:hypothetical protein